MPDEFPGYDHCGRLQQVHRPPRVCCHKWLAKALYVLDKFNDLGVVNYTYSSGCVIFKIFELAVSVDDNNVEDGDVLVIRKMFAKSGNVRTVLPDRIIELMLFLPECKCPAPPCPRSASGLLSES